MILNLDDAPTDPLDRLAWLTGVKEQAAKELDAELGRCYFDARLKGQLETAITVGPYARKRVLALTRRENDRRGRTVRWGDRADKTSTAYYRND